MPRITTKTKIGLYISMISILLIILTGAIFIIVYSRSVERQLQNDLLIEAEEIVSQYIVTQGERIVYANDPAGKSIQNDLLTDQASAVIFNKNLEIIGKFGLFEQFTDQQISPEQSILNQVFQSQEYSYYSQIKINQDFSYAFVYYPIVNQAGNVLGVLQIGMRTDLLNSISQTLIYLIVLVVVLSVIICTYLGQLISKYAFAPARRLLDKMQEISAANLDLLVEPQGHPQDELFQLSQTFNQMLARIQDGFTKQKEFIANASHELKSPIARAISTMEVAEIQLADKQFASVKERLTMAKSDINELSETISSMLLLSKIDEQQNIRQNYAKVAIRSLLEKRLVFFQKIYPTKHTSQIVHVDNNLMILFNQEYLQIMVDNLLSNIFKYAKDNCVITITTEIEKDNKVALIIQDDGPGIAKDDLTKIFERFYRGKGSHNLKGHGLGLAIVKQICELHNLEIAIDSQINKFTLVKISGFASV